MSRVDGARATLRSSCRLGIEITWARVFKCSTTSTSMKARNSSRRRRFLCRTRDLARRHLERGEQGGDRGRSVVAVSRQRASVRQLQIALRALQRLDRRFLVGVCAERGHLGSAMRRRTTSAALLRRTSGSLLSHQLSATAEIDLLRRERGRRAPSALAEALRSAWFANRRGPLVVMELRPVAVDGLVLRGGASRTSPWLSMKKPSASGAPPPQLGVEVVLAKTAILGVPTWSAAPVRYAYPQQLSLFCCIAQSRYNTARSSASAEPRSHQVSSRS